MFVASTQPVMDAQVMVVGAGPAGLAAARELARLGLTAVVLEASRRPGGRAIDAEFAYDAATDPIRFEVPLVPHRGWHYGVFSGRAQRICPTSLSRFAGGPAALIGNLSQHIDLRLGVAARGVQWRRASVLLHTTAGLLAAETAILAVPPPIQDALDIRPGLPKTGLPMLEEITVRLTLAEPLWEERFPGLSMLHSADAGVPVWWTAGSNTLSGWACGRRAHNLSAKPAEEVRGRAVESLARLLREHPRELKHSVTACEIHDWQSDPFARGGRCLAPGPAFADPVEGTLFFAGEHTDAEGGSVAAAIRSGIRAARQVAAETHRRGALSNS